MALIFQRLRNLHESLGLSLLEDLSVLQNLSERIAYLVFQAVVELAIRTSKNILIYERAGPWINCLAIFVLKQLFWVLFLMHLDWFEAML